MTHYKQNATVHAKSHVDDPLLEQLHALLLVVVGQLDELLVAELGHVIREVVVVIAADASRQLQILLHYRDALGVDSAQLRVLEDTHEVSLSGLLKGDESLRSESEIGIVVLADFADDPLEGRTRQQQISALLVPLDLAEGDSAGLVSDLSLLAVLRGSLLGSLRHLAGGRLSFLGLVGSHLGLRAHLASGILSFRHLENSVIYLHFEVIFSMEQEMFLVF